MESIVAFIITALALGFVGLPLFRERKQDDIRELDGLDPNPEEDRLLSQKDTAINAIRELEFDYAVGNLSDEDYKELKEKYERRAIAVLKTLDEVGETGTNGRGREASRRVARAARSRRAEKPRPSELACPECGESYGAGDQSCRACGAEVGVDAEPALACLKCGEPYQEDDVYCGACGSRLDLTSGESQSTSAGSGGRELPPTKQSAASFREGDVAAQKKRIRRGRQGRHGGNGRDGK